MKNFYKLLDLEPEASQEVIKTAYRICAKKYHPDKHPDNPDFYNALFAEVNEAYEVLSNTDLRREYDEQFFFYYRKTVEEKVVINEEVFKQKEEFEIIEIKRSIPFIKHKFEINKNVVQYNNKSIPIESINGIAFGYTATGLFWGEYDFFIKFQSNDEVSLDIPLMSMLTSDEYRYTKYLAILDLVNYYVVPSILSKLITRLDNGETININDSVQINRVGIILPKINKIIIWSNLEIKEGKWRSLGYLTEKLILLDKSNPNIKQKIVPLWHLNAVLIPILHNFYIANSKEIILNKKQEI